MKNQIYLDYNSTTPVDSEVHKTMQPYFSFSAVSPLAIGGHVLPNQPVLSVLFLSQVRKSF